jgi:hypothetical protein
MAQAVQRELRCRWILELDRKTMLRALNEGELEKAK